VGIRTDAPWPHLADGNEPLLRTEPDDGKPLFTFRTPDGDTLAFDCLSDGYSVRRNGVSLPGWRWPTERIDVALAAYRGLIAASEPKPAGTAHPPAHVPAA
jgi:hypothetical protein